MARLHAQPHSAAVDQDIVVFLIGARLNRPWKLCSVRQVVTAMNAMLRTLDEQPELGLLHVEHFRRGRTTLSVQYWESHDKLQRFATDKDLPHAPAWAAFMRDVATTGDVGIWHETYLVPATNTESIYAHMPRFGLARATRHVPTRQVGGTARQRLARRPAAA